MPTVQADASPAQDAFRIARKLADAAVPAMADIVAVEISDAALEEHSAMSGVGAGGGFRRAAFRAVRDGSRGAYRIGEASRIPCGTPYRRSVIDQRPRVIAHVAPRTRWLARDPVRAPLLRESGVHSLLVVPLTAQHAVLGMAAFYRCGGSPPFGQADLRAAADLSQRVARMLDGVHRDLRGQAIGRMLQDALLPQPPEVTAIEEVQSHVPSDSVPGGWFDVIPLAGTRVGLAVGFADGRGITAAVAMSQQKSQIRALAALDFEPAEILTHALGPTHRETAPSAGQQHAGAGHRAKSHCLYAVYDPVTHRCAAAWTGAAALTLVGPGDRVRSVGPTAPAPDGSLSHDSAEFDVAPGSLLVLSSAGTHPHRRTPDIRVGSGRTGTGAGRPAREVRPSVLLAARTRGLAPTDVATWDLPNDPAVVADARSRATTQLTAWGLPDLSFTNSLVVSELVTNAIRYSDGPIRLRLIRDRALICEVSDTSSRAPHACRAAPSDQGGRGLSIVAELTQAQGMRYTPTGKIVWAEQTLDPG